MVDVTETLNFLVKQVQGFIWSHLPVLFCVSAPKALKRVELQINLI